MSFKGDDEGADKSIEFNPAHELALTTLDGTAIALKFFEEYMNMGGSPPEAAVARWLSQNFIRRGLVGTTKKTLNNVLKKGESGAAAINHGLFENIVDVCIKKISRCLKIKIVKWRCTSFWRGTNAWSASIFLSCFYWV
jgi:hypothetical protein